jgi:hypothetical protein
MFCTTLSSAAPPSQEREVKPDSRPFSESEMHHRRQLRRNAALPVVCLATGYLSVSPEACLRRIIYM